MTFARHWTNVMVTLVRHIHSETTTASHLLNCVGFSWVQQANGNAVVSNFSVVWCRTPAHMHPHACRAHRRRCFCSRGIVCRKISAAVRPNNTLWEAPACDRSAPWHKGQDPRVHMVSLRGKPRRSVLMLANLAQKLSSRRSAPGAGGASCSARRSGVTALARA